MKTDASHPYFYFSAFAMKINFLAQQKNKKPASAGFHWVAEKGGYKASFYSISTHPN
jgi:hypothetical protein